MSEHKIRVFLVDDSETALFILKKLITQQPDMEVVGTAKTGKEALGLIPKARPDILCTDFYMPRMDGLELTKKIMGINPLPILIVSGLLSKNDQTKVFPILEAGALDITNKPSGLDLEDKTNGDFIQKIRILSKVYVFKKRKFSKTNIEENTENFPSPFHYSLLIIGASTGGPLALKTILSDFPANFPLPIICIQHIENGFLNGFVEWLNLNIKLHAKIMENNESPKPGIIYFPKENYHLLISQTGKLMSSQEHLTLQPHRPSIDVSMKSIAAHYGDEVIGVLLTGMGKDGGQGMLAISKVGGLTIVQDATTSVVNGMPEEAIKLHAAQHILPINHIAAFIKKMTLKK